MMHPSMNLGVTNFVVHQSFGFTSSVLIVEVILPDVKTDERANCPSAQLRPCPVRFGTRLEKRTALDKGKPLARAGRKATGLT